MAGLLGSLDVALESGTFSASIDLQVQGLDQIVSAVAALTDGPPDLADLQGLLNNMPLPPGLSGLASLPGTIGVLVDGIDMGDIPALLGPVLGPLASIGGPDFSLAGIADIKASMCLVQQVLALIAGQGSGANGFPLSAGLWGRQRFGVDQDISPEELREQVQLLESQLDGLGPHLDGPGFVAMLRKLGPRWNEMQNWPNIPVLTDVMEIAGVAVRWDAMNGPQLTSELDARLGEIQTLIAMPRTRVVDPFVAQAEAAAALPGALAFFAGPGIVLLSSLDAKVRNGIKPTYNEVAQLEAHVGALAGAVDALDLTEDRPLGRFDDLIRDLELHLLRAVRTMVPPYDVSMVTAWAAGVLDMIPDPVADPLAEAVETVANLDISFLTNPMSAVTQAVQGVVDDIQGAMGALSDTLTGVLEPVADGLDAALAAAGLDGIAAELAALPQTIEDFIDDQIEPAIAPIRSGIEAAVTTVTQAADEFSPEAIIEPLEAAIDEIAGLLNNPEIAGVAAEIQQTLQGAVDTLAGLDFASAADEVVQALGEVEAKLAELDPISLPEPALQLAEQAVAVVTDIDFTAEVAAPILDAAGEALSEGPSLILSGMQTGIDELRRALDQFKPSVVIGKALDEPFSAALDSLDDFTPSGVLDGISDMLKDAVQGVNLVDPTVVIQPLEQVHGTLLAAIESARPSTLVEPVNAAIAAAVARLFEITGIDDVFDGIDNVVSTITDWVALVNETRSVLERAAELLSNPGTIDAALNELVTTIVDRLDVVDLNSLAPRFAALADTVRSVESPVIAARIAAALRMAQAAVGPALAGPNVPKVISAARAFPLIQLKASPEAPVRKRLVEAVEILLAAVSDLEPAGGAWTAFSRKIDERAPRLNADLATYSRLSVIDGQHVFADCIIPAATLGQLKTSVGNAVRDGLELPVTVFFGIFAKVAPLVASVTHGLAELIGAIHEKLDQLTGQGGLSGVVGSLEEAADLLRNLDLSPVTGPMDAVYARIEAAGQTLDPAPLKAALETASQSMAGLLDISNLIDPAASAQLDAVYNGTLDKLRALKPSAIVAEVLDPKYATAVAQIQPILDLPAMLRALLEEARAGFSDELTAQLERVEIAFDAMLRAIPFGPMSTKASLKVSVSASVSA